MEGTGSPGNVDLQELKQQLAVINDRMAMHHDGWSKKSKVLYMLSQHAAERKHQKGMFARSWWKMQLKRRALIGFSDNAFGLRGRHSRELNSNPGGLWRFLEESEASARMVPSGPYLKWRDQYKSASQQAVGSSYGNAAEATARTVPSGTGHDRRRPPNGTTIIACETETDQYRSPPMRLKVTVSRTSSPSHTNGGRSPRPFAHSRGGVRGAHQEEPLGGPDVSANGILGRKSGRSATPEPFRKVPTPSYLVTAAGRAQRRGREREEPRGEEKEGVERDGGDHFTYTTVPPSSSHDAVPRPTSALPSTPAMTVTPSRDRGAARGESLGGLQRSLAPRRIDGTPSLSAPQLSGSRLVGSRSASRGALFSSSSATGDGREEVHAHAVRDGPLALLTPPTVPCSSVSCVNGEWRGGDPIRVVPRGGGQAGRLMSFGTAERERQWGRETPPDMTMRTHAEVPFGASLRHGPPPLPLGDGPFASYARTLTADASGPPTTHIPEGFVSSPPRGRVGGGGLPSRPASRGGSVARGTVTTPHPQPVGDDATPAVVSTRPQSPGNSAAFQKVAGRIGRLAGGGDYLKRPAFYEGEASFEEEYQRARERAAGGGEWRPYATYAGGAGDFDGGLAGPSRTVGAIGRVNAGLDSGPTASRVSINMETSPPPVELRMTRTIRGDPVSANGPSGVIQSQHHEKRTAFDSFRRAIFAPPGDEAEGPHLLAGRLSGAVEKRLQWGFEGLRGKAETHRGVAIRRALLSVFRSRLLSEIARFHYKRGLLKATWSALARNIPKAVHSRVRSREDRLELAMKVIKQGRLSPRRHALSRSFRRWKWETRMHRSRPEFIAYLKHWLPPQRKPGTLLPPRSQAQMGGTVYGGQVESVSVGAPLPSDSLSPGWQRTPATQVTAPFPFQQLSLHATRGHPHVFSAEERDPHEASVRRLQLHGSFEGSGRGSPPLRDRAPSPPLSPSNKGAAMEGPMPPVSGQRRSPRMPLPAYAYGVDRLQTPPEGESAPRPSSPLNRLSSPRSQLRAHRGDPVPSSAYPPSASVAQRDFWGWGGLEGGAPVDAATSAGHRGRGHSPNAAPVRNMLDFSFGKNPAGVDLEALARGGQGRGGTLDAEAEGAQVELNVRVHQPAVAAPPLREREREQRGSASKRATGLGGQPQMPPPHAPAGPLVLDDDYWSQRASFQQRVHRSVR
uniref:Uncharacterized protein n=1 Tax=Chromera velia CCMP2878 TaxID=1169474 RepID=A0A0G4HL57_9ALVE|eukprot:Cvel_28642.t1-p1 / transcript=Cvel_28642.t1 / gene=Cvel_28642 / organism=Chromera_velia_CCMP2878 / gene_product=hypothetical protein / transcript_product=hypothetical protein / location=Cvel_scaffold3787:3731-11447(-) / protein_length=1188 / sequence_SO=supercontig / SO=protein_coding / is_pseudo=false